MVMRTRGNGWWIALLLIAAVLLLWMQPLVFGKLIPQVDYITHLRWSHQFQIALSEGWLSPRWAFASHRGLGDPTFLYYSPLLYYLSALFKLAGLSPENALLAAACTPYLLLAVISASLFRKPGNFWVSIAGGLFVVTCPALYFLSTHYGALPWVLAMPLVVLFAVYSLQDAPDPLRIAATFALICLSHILSGLMILLAVGGVRLLLWWQGKRESVNQIKWGAGLALGMGLAAFYLFPALTLQHLINPTGWTDDPTLDWRRAFAFPIVSYLHYGTRWFAIQWPLPLLTVAMLVCVFLISKANAMGEDAGYRTLAKRLALTASVGLLLSSELAYPFYSNISQLQKLQWPYRFVVPSLLLATVAFSLLLGNLDKRIILRWLVIVVALLQVVMVAHMQYSIAVYGKAIPTLEKVFQGEFGQPEYLPASRGDGWKNYLETGGFDAYCQTQGFYCETLITQSHLHEWRITVLNHESVTLPLFAFPGWVSRVNGQPVPKSVDPATGLLAVILPKGKNDVTVSWSTLPEELLGRWISLASLCLFGAILLLRLRRVQSAYGRRQF